MSENAKKVIAILIPLVGVFIIFIVFTTVNNSRFRLVSGASNELSAYAPIVLEFNRELDKTIGNNQISTSPQIIGSRKLEDNRLIYQPTYGFELEETYIVTVTNIVSVDGDKLGDFSFEFKALNIPYSDLNEAQQEESVSSSSSFEKDGVLSQLPYQNADFRIDFKVEQGTVEIENEVIYSVTTYQTYETSDLTAYKNDHLSKRQLALDWLEKNGVDIANVRVIYKPTFEDSDTAEVN